MAERKSTAVLIKLSPAEKRALDAAARRENLPMATWMRALCLHAARAANEKGHTMKTILVASMLAFAVACGGTAGSAGTEGPTAPVGQQAPAAPTAPASPVRIRMLSMFNTFDSGATVGLECPANSHAIGGGCNCSNLPDLSGAPADVQLRTSKLITTSTGTQACVCLSPTQAKILVEVQVMCVDGDAVTVQY
jgi:hypothetical protein